MRTLSAAIRRGTVAVLASCVAVSTLTAPAASAATALPHFADSFGVTVTKQPEWFDGSSRTFVMEVKSAEVPAFTVLDGQVSGVHPIMVTLPAGYDAAASTRYPVQYYLHGGGDIPNSPWTKQILEKSTTGVPLITVAPNGGGRSWYSNWVNPGALGKQNWETFHVDQLIPFIDANLRTIAAKGGRAISGYSMGAFGAFHYAEHRPDLFAYVGSFSGGLDLLSQEMRVAVVGTMLQESYGSPTVAIDSIFGPPVWPQDGVWNAQSPAQHVGSLRGLGVAMYTGDGGNLLEYPIQALVENRARQTALVTAAHLDGAGIPYHFSDYRDGSGWGVGCTGKHSQLACMQADLDHFVPLIMKRLHRP